MKKPFFLAAVFMLGLLLALPLYSHSSTAIHQWMDDFDDGNLDEWTILTGGFSLENQRLEAGSSLINCMSRPSTNAYGWWSFDAYTWDSNWNGGWAVSFVALDVDFPDFPRNGYFLWVDEAFYEFTRRINSVPTIMSGYQSLNTWGPSRESINEMVHVDIVRHSNGHMYVWLNYTGEDPETGIFFDATDTTFTNSSYFMIYMVGKNPESPGYPSWIDNIRVDNNPDNGPPPSQNDGGGLEWVMLVTPWAIGLCLVVGGLVVCWRRQKKVEITPGDELQD